MTRRLSKWSKPGEKPPMVGVWETKLIDEPEPDPNGVRFFQHWNGEFYGCTEATAQDAKTSAGNVSSICMEKICFRGLADKPE